MVYASLTFTPMHDLMISISLGFHAVAVTALLYALYASRERGFFQTGCVCFLVLIATACIYYTNHLGITLVWAQRLSFALFAAWMLALHLRVCQVRTAIDTLK